MPARGQVALSWFGCRVLYASARLIGMPLLHSFAPPFKPRLAHTRGWLLRLLRTSRLEALVRWRLDDIADLAEELAAATAATTATATGTTGGSGSTGGGVGKAQHRGSSTSGAAALSGLDAEEAEAAAKLMAGGLRSARKLQEAAAAALPGILAPHGAAGDAGALEGFLKKLAPLVAGGEEPIRQLELQEEAQVGAVGGR